MPVELVCETCGDSFETPPHKAERSDNHYCSSSCYGKSIGKGKVDVTCEYCGNEFERYAGNIEGSTFCDSDCHNAYQREESPQGEESPGWKGGKVTATCFNCGSKFEDYPSRIGRGEHTFCSRQCAAVIHEKKSHRIDGRKVTQTHRWRKLREKIIERDGGRCQICNFGDHLHVHHIKPMSEGGEPFDPDNLVTVCETCHYSVLHESGTHGVGPTDV